MMLGNFVETGIVEHEISMGEYGVEYLFSLGLCFYLGW